MSNRAQRRAQGPQEKPPQQPQPMISVTYRDAPAQFADRYLHVTWAGVTKLSFGEFKNDNGIIINSVVVMTDEDAMSLAMSIIEGVKNKQAAPQG